MKNRYKYDEKSVLTLNSAQKEMKEQLKSAINSKIEFEFIECPVCEKKEFNIISEKDRYGIFQPVKICRSCGLILSNPRMTQESYKIFYEKYHKQLYLGESSVTDEYYSNQVKRGEKIYRFISRNTNEKISGKRVLEVGCSSGGILEKFKQEGNEVFGIDLIPEYVEYGKNRGLNLKVGTIDEVKLPWTPDIVIYSHTIEHILNPIDEMSKIKDKFGDDVIIYLETPGVFNLYNSHQRDFLRSLQSAHTYYFTLETLSNLMQKSGYTLVEGNQEIKALYQPSSNPENEINNMYSEEIKFFRKMNYLRHIPTTYQLKRVALVVSKRLGIEKQVREIYNKLT